MGIPLLTLKIDGVHGVRLSLPPLNKYINTRVEGLHTPYSYPVSKHTRNFKSYPINHQLNMKFLGLF